jgi:hypothetical protein
MKRMGKARTLIAAAVLSTGLATGLGVAEATPGHAAIWMYGWNSAAFKTACLGAGGTYTVLGQSAICEA